jgi:hypothetical protein
MLAYPQLSTGALAQFPARKRRRARTIYDAAEDGTAFKLSDPGAATTEWRLTYAALADAEAAALRAFFEATEGTLGQFTFLDPMGNLLEWSGKLDAQAWEKAPEISVSGGVADPAGGSNAWRLTNSGAAPQYIRQSLAVPGGFVYCVSVYARAAQTGMVTLLRGPERLTAPAGPAWGRITSAGSTGTAGEETQAFGLELAPGAVVEVYGFQVEPQGAASAYKASTDGGVYAGARFADDALSITTSGANRHAVTVNIIHAKHL